MKKLLIVMVLGTLLAYLIPANAQQQEWQSASTMQGSGSRYSSQVTPVGASGVAPMSSTGSTFGPVQAPTGPRKGFDTMAESGQGSESPIGDAVLPLFLCAVAFGGYIAIRRKRSAANA